MAERPCTGASGIRLNHGADDGSDRARLSVNDDQSCSQFQDEETQTKKTENGKINGFVVEGEETPASVDLDSSLHSASQNGDKLLLESDLKPNSSTQTLHTGLKGERKGNKSRNSMDCKNDKPSELTTLEGKKEALASLNGVVTLITNGYPGRSGTDNDGSGSESGYTTPKKRRAQRNGRSLDNVTALSQIKAMQQASKQEPGLVTPELADRTSATQVEISRASSKTDSHFSGFTKTREATTTPPALPVPEVYRKSAGKKFEDKSTKTKVSASTKEDSWTLFKPPPVFPVDNSSAKIVPKISYASKVKENLNKAAQTGTENPTPAPQVPGRPSQVPMSAVKTITSASFSNGDGNACPLPGPHFTSVPSSSPVPVVSSAGSDHVASSSGSSCNPSTFISTTTPEPRKPNLFVYPLSASSSSNMQLSLPSGRQSDPPPNQKSLGDIFQNQWGLSFINEPSSGPEGPMCNKAAKDKIGDVSFQGGCTAAVATQTHSASHRPDQSAFPDKRTSAQNLSKGGNLTVTTASEGSLQTLKFEVDTLKDEPVVSGAIAFCSSSKDVGLEQPCKLSLPRDQGFNKDFERRASWDFFDLKAAVLYHTKEMEYILNLQKQGFPKVRMALCGTTAANAAKMMVAYSGGASAVASAAHHPHHHHQLAHLPPPHQIHHQHHHHAGQHHLQQQQQQHPAPGSAAAVHPVQQQHASAAVMLNPSQQQQQQPYFPSPAPGQAPGPAAAAAPAQVQAAAIKAHHHHHQHHLQQQLDIEPDRPIGYGAFGVVWSVTDPRDGKRVALKKMPNVFQNLVSCKRVFRELKMLCFFKHDNYAGSGSCVCGGVCVCACVREISLRLMSCEGLKYLHSAGILHRDIKPGNLLVNSNCVLKICDFGLARVEEPDESRHMTQEVVTQYYRAPEILMGSRHYTNAIDIWSVGCIFAELLGRRILFQAQSPIQQLDLITDLLGTPSLEAMRTACEGARAHILRGPHKQPSLPVLYTLSSQATHEAVHLLCRMLVFDPSKRISAKDALAHPYLDEGRLRYHTCMCKCCYTTSSGRVYTSDFEPVTNPKFDDGFEKNLTSVRQVKEIIHQFILEQQKGNRVPLCINPQSAAFKSFISSTVAQPSEMPPSPLVWE
ncbi:Serine/threonine-protein kinase NLK [Bagarius yarrelli]|uniref:mitogen-activated protein kinase n=3 Tax=Euteleostomi TaxID=117571 RepID=A0A556TRQ3_BAGYA|nr:Serine/threonine-protein kinase NLK [Bagarius yarrelli]